MIRWADPERVAHAVEQYAATLRQERPEVRRIYWYGSWVTGTATPASDADLCVVIAADPRRPRERTPDYLPERFPVGVDLTVLTEAEWRQLPLRSPEWHKAIVSGRRL